ncbi:MAG: hypothetical protein ACRCX8_04225 [Sarcina sp.]
MNLFEEYSGSFPGAKDFISKSFAEVVNDYNNMYNSNANYFRYTDEVELNAILTDIYEVADYEYEVDFDKGIVIIPQMR